MPPRLSIVVPFYNVGDYIRDCVESLARQTFQDYEVVMVDDGSQDNSADIAHAYASRDSRFRVVTQENLGLGPARNTGTRHSVGEYITFVDSDDLVPPYAYQSMVSSLDSSGSSFVGGNARRFNNASGVKKSYLQNLVFTGDKKATHILENTVLALDRMVWNKVYRRSFWDEFELEFPAIRYEDYPVTLKAHLDAVTVDCLAAPVYFWRERESGESITQQKFHYDNLADRILSAEMVLDLIDTRAPELRDRVHRHFAQIDLATVVQAFATAQEHEELSLVELGQRLTRRLDLRVLRRASAYDQLQYHALAAGDTDQLRRLAEFRATGGLGSGARARRSSLFPWRFQNHYPTAGSDSTVPRQLYRLRRRELSLYTTVTRMSWDDTALSIRGTAEIRHLPVGANSTLRLTLVAGTLRMELPVERFTARDSHGEETLVGFQTRVSKAVLAKLPADVSGARIKVSLRAGAFHRRNLLRNVQPGNPQNATGTWIDEDTWIQPGNTNAGEVVLRRMIRPLELTGATVDGEEIVLTGRMPTDLNGAWLQLARSSETTQVELETQLSGKQLAYTARVPFTSLVDSASPDDPFTLRTTRVPSVRRGNQRHLILATGLDAPVATVYKDRLIAVTRSPGQCLNVVEGPLQLQADTANATPAGVGHRLSVQGRLWTDADPGAVVWRRYVDAADHHVDMSCRVTRSDGRWSAEVELSELLAPGGIAQPGSDLLADWTLWVLPPDGESPYALQADIFLVAQLPLPIDAGGRTAGLYPRSGRLHLEVR
ncbi:glycosyltransferase family 2 protein [Salinispora fenicalii]|uniref:glycosyltransferase family 2 protein n=1 Tax=Salinispora fenicalii TaxID=1137263 RepID=UPI000486BB88|nr:glycosyltransferase family 2 protein [Salinispora fenicalii]